VDREHLLDLPEREERLKHDLTRGERTRRWWFDCEKTGRKFARQFRAVLRETEVVNVDWLLFDLSIPKHIER
jgi:hypothetical protein